MKEWTNKHLKKKKRWNRGLLSLYREKASSKRDRDAPGCKFQKHEAKEDDDFGE